jgi:hypothetical protein
MRPRRRHRFPATPAGLVACLKYAIESEEADGEILFDGPEESGQFIRSLHAATVEMSECLSVAPMARMLPRVIGS